MLASCQVLFYILGFAFSASSVHLTFLVLSQHSAYELSKSASLKSSVNLQGRQHQIATTVFLSHESFGPRHGHWTIFPIIESLLDEMVKRKSEWLIVLEPETTVELSNLKKYLANLRTNEDYFLGYGLVDKRPTIIHHFYGFEEGSSALEYPDFAAGCAISMPLVKKLVSSLRKHDYVKNEFAIDSKHEFAKFVLLTTGVRLTSAQDVFCLFPYPACSLSYHQPTYSENDSCKQGAVTVNDVSGAVKTYSGNHRSRVVAVKRTWAKELKYLDFFSDIEDHYVPTKTLGINNTQRGHCAKTLAILRHFAEQRPTNAHLDWLLLADDDTLISVARIFRLLGCYDHSKPIIVGERYGYGFSVDGEGGYDYPTGGSGMIFSRKAATELAKNCKCPKDDSPDDMIIGACSRTLSISIIHTAALHQARSIDYSSIYIQRILPISFHKFEDINPYDEYMKYLHEDLPTDWRVHSEL